MTDDPQDMPQEQPEDMPQDEPEDADQDVIEDLDQDIVEEQASPEPETTTGHPAVDEVLRSLGSLESAPVDEHVAVFEQAHDQLRRTLSGAGDE